MGETNNIHNNNSLFAPPAWLLLFVLGIAIGKSSQSMEGWDSLLSFWQSFVNQSIVPLYAFYVFFYLAYITIGIVWNCCSSYWKHRHRSKVENDASQLQQQQREEELEEAEDYYDKDGNVNMTGSYKLFSNHKFEEFLAAQGVPWALRSAANQARPVHHITQQGTQVTIQIKGLIESQTTFEINGPPVQDVIRGRVFTNRMEYTKANDGIVVHKTAESEGYRVTVTRQLSKDRQTITMTSRAMFDDEQREDVESVQIFKRN